MHGQSERIWELGRALSGAGAAEPDARVAQQLSRLAQRQAALLAAEWATYDLAA